MTVDVMLTVSVTYSVVMVLLKSPGAVMLNFMASLSSNQMTYVELLYYEYYIPAAGMHG